MSTSRYTLAELCITQCAEVWRDAGEVLATGFGVVPRLGAGLATLTFSPDLMMTDGEAYLLAEPVALGPRAARAAKVEGWMPYSRTFDLLWQGRRHALVGPVQVDRYGQMNISLVGDYARPKAAILGVRGLAGNSISHPNSMFVPNHSPRVFVSGEVDMVCSAGYNPARWPEGKVPESLVIGRVITNLGVLDFGGKDHAPRLLSVHPGVSVAEVIEATGFPLECAAEIPVTPAPTDEQLALIRERLDPQNLRATAFKGNPPGDRTSSA
ncbi:MAG: CoA-transferase subunit beta [Steroidobacteraceae bacterium]